jgi:hypothetical protein
MKGWHLHCSFVALLGLRAAFSKRAPLGTVVNQTCFPAWWASLTREYNARFF